MLEVEYLFERVFTIAPKFSGDCVPGYGYHTGYSCDRFDGNGSTYRERNSYGNTGPSYSTLSSHR